jgi:hypothetical protein
VNWPLVIGLVLQLIGSGLAGEALYDSLKTHGDGQLVPAVSHGLAWIRRRFGRPKTVMIIVGGAVASMEAIRSPRVVQGLPEDAPVEDQLAAFRKRFAFLSQCRPRGHRPSGQ